MKKLTIDEIMNSLNCCMGADVSELKKSYDIWYITKKRGIRRHKIFYDTKEAKKWYKRNKCNIIIHSGHYLLLDMFDML